MNLNSPNAKNPGEEGYTLLSVIFLVALLTLSLAVAVPRLTREIQRDRELECIHRGQQYARAIRLYYRKFGDYPTSISQLENTNNIRFLRKHYIDPMTKSEFKLVYQGEVLPTTFERSWWQTAGGSSTLGVAKTFPRGVIQDPSLSGFGTNPPSEGNGGVSKILIPPDSGTSGAFTTTGPAGDGNSDSRNSSSGFDGTTPLNTRRIVGVTSTSSHESIIVVHKQSQYNKWQFVYDPSVDGIAGGGQQGVNGVSLSTPLGIVPQPPPSPPPSGDNPNPPAASAPNQQ